MADKLPYQITPGTPNDASVVHASDADESDLSRSHDERDISRLQGTAPVYDAAKTYNLNDLVTQSNTVYRCSTAIGTPEAFDPSKWTIVGEPHTANVPDYSTLETYEVGDLVDEDRLIWRCGIAITVPEAFDDSKWVTVGNSIPPFSSTAFYSLGNLISESGINYTANGNVVPGAFDRSDWTVVWATQDIEYIFEESDFPAPVSGEIPLESGKLYQICAPVTITNSLMLPIGGIVGFKAENRLSYSISSDNAGEAFIDGIDNIVDILSFADSGGDLLITTSAVHNLSPGDLVNVKADNVAAYTQLTATVITTPDTDEFTISGTFSITDTGTIDQGSLLVDMNDLFLFDISGGPPSSFFKINMTLAMASFCQIDNIMVKQFDGIGDVKGAGIVNIKNSECGETHYTKKI